MIEKAVEAACDPAIYDRRGWVVFVLLMLLFTVVIGWITREIYWRHP